MIEAERFPSPRRGPIHSAPAPSTKLGRGAEINRQ